MREEILKIAKNFERLVEQAESIEAVARMCQETIMRGGKILFCGNGGSAADSQHLAAELVGRFKRERTALPAIALTVDTSILTAVGNDYGFDDIFARQVEALATKGDVLIGLSTSGNSANVLKAFAAAKAKGVTTVALTGESGGQSKSVADHCLRVPASTSDHIQEMHIAIGHLICGYIEN